MVAEKPRGATQEVQFVDGFGNDTRLVSIDGEPHTIVIEASGVVETRDTAGVTGKHQGLAPLWLFQQQTPLCTAGRGISALLRGIDGETDVERLHSLMSEVRDRVAYRIGTTDAGTPAETALANGEGVCQGSRPIYFSLPRV